MMLGYGEWSVNGSACLPVMLGDVMPARRWAARPIGIGQPQFDREGFAQSLLNKVGCSLRRHRRRLVPNRSDRNRPTALTA